MAFSPFQIFSLCAVSTGIGTLCFAPFYYTDGGADAAWPYAVLIAAALASLMTALYIHTSGNLGRDSFSEILSRLLTPVFSRILLFAAGIFFAVQSAFTAFAAADAAGMYLLERTPRGIILLAVIFTACIVHDSGLKYTSRCCELLLMIVALPLAALLLLCLLNVDLSEAAVIFQPDISALIRMIPPAVISCSGASAVIFAAGHKSAGSKSAALGFFCSAAISVILFICSAGIFTADGTAVQKFPFIEMARSVSIGAISLTERFDAIFISIMLIAAIAQLALLGGCASHCLSSVFSLNSQKCFTWLLLPVIFAIAYYAEYQAFRGLLCQIILRGTVVFLIVIIPAIYFAGRFTKKEVSADA